MLEIKRCDACGITLSSDQIETNNGWQVCDPCKRFAEQRAKFEAEAKNTPKPPAEPIFEAPILSQPMRTVLR